MVMVLSTRFSFSHLDPVFIPRTCIFFFQVLTMLRAVLGAETSMDKTLGFIELSVYHIFSNPGKKESG